MTDQTDQSDQSDQSDQTDLTDQTDQTDQTLTRLWPDCDQTVALLLAMVTHHLKM